MVIAWSRIGCDLWAIRNAGPKRDSTPESPAGAKAGSSEQPIFIRVGSPVTPIFNPFESVIYQRETQRGIACQRAAFIDPASGSSLPWDT